MHSPHKKPQKGFTLIEVLIAFIILSFGLLGAVALQAKAK
ncbi:prepilin-type N-terminal cleavage/methylation domain-containing protein, partial [uncultured Pseudoalteromonas sp.]